MNTHTRRPRSAGADRGPHKRITRRSNPPVTCAGHQRLIIGDVRELIQRVPDASVDLVVTSPPFLGLRSYLPDTHPDKDLEIGGEATPDKYVEVLLQLTADWARVLAPHGSLAVELGDTYSRSGGSGGSSSPDGLRPGQPNVEGTDSRRRRIVHHDSGRRTPGHGWPLAKSLAGVPEAYMLSLAYGINVLSGSESAAGRWRVRNVKPFIRTNPPVGALADKERPATSFVIVATRARDRYFDLDAVRHANPRVGEAGSSSNHRRARAGRDPGYRQSDVVAQNRSGAPPLDWAHHVDLVLDAALRDNAAGHSHPRTARAVERRPNNGKAAAARRGGNWSTLDIEHQGRSGGIRGWHLRRALEHAGLCTTAEALAINPARYRGAHYAVWPAELVRVLVEEMCPRRVCVTCGAPSRRLPSTDSVCLKVAWTTCGCPGTEPDDQDGWHTARGWRPGRVLDPFVGSGTTLQVAAEVGRDVLGVDLDSRNESLAKRRCGPGLIVETAAEATEVFA